MSRNNISLFTREAPCTRRTNRMTLHCMVNGAGASRLTTAIASVFKLPFFLQSFKKNLKVYVDFFFYIFSVKSTIL